MAGTTAGPTFRLVLILDAPTLAWEDARASLVAVLAAVPKGSTLLVDRDRPSMAGGSSDAARWRRLVAMREETARWGAPLAIGGRVDLALAVGADGVQLPERGLDAAVVRATFPSLWVGRSCHDRAGLDRAAAAGAHWATLSPVHAPFSKAPTGAPLGVRGFARAIAGLALPVVGLGGIDGAAAAALFDAGAAAVATLGGVLGRADAVDRACALLAGAPSGPLGPS